MIKNIIDLAHYSKNLPRSYNTKSVTVEVLELTTEKLLILKMTIYLLDITRISSGQKVK